MQSSRWLGLGVYGGVAKTLLHLFPAARNVSAPYPLQCKVTVFGSSEPRAHPLQYSSRLPVPFFETVSVEGLRLTQPDGVWLHDLFSQFPVSPTAGDTWVGVQVEFLSNQPHMELGLSSVLVELVSPEQLARYSPERLAEVRVSSGREVTGTFSPTVIGGTSPFSSLIAVHSGTQKLEVALIGRQQGQEPHQETLLLEPRSVTEIVPEMSDSLLVAPQWRAGSSVAWYAVGRDPTHRTIQAVLPLERMQESFEFSPQQVAAGADAL